MMVYVTFLDCHRSFYAFCPSFFGAVVTSKMMKEVRDLLY